MVRRLPAPLFATVLFERSTTDTSFDGPLAEYKVLPSAESAMPHGRCPTSNDVTGLLVAVSMIKTFWPRPVLT